MKASGASLYEIASTLKRTRVANENRVRALKHRRAAEPGWESHWNRRISWRLGFVHALSEEGFMVKRELGLMVETPADGPRHGKYPSIVGTLIVSLILALIFLEALWCVFFRA
jgi:hypothetical protein